MPAWLSFILGFLADWLKRLSDPEFDRKQAEVHREVREREALATDQAATQAALDQLERRRKEMRSEAPTLENLSDRDAVRARLPLE